MDASALALYYLIIASVKSAYDPPNYTNTMADSRVASQELRFTYPNFNNLV